MRKPLSSETQLANYRAQFAASTLGSSFYQELIRSLRRSLRRFNWLRSRRFGRVDQQIIRDYQSNHSSWKLHIGAGDNLLEGWLNTNYNSRSPRAIHLDATRPFPFPDNSFDYVFSEHMIEHISYTQGQVMLAECKRILKPGGRIRTSTPDFQYLLDLYLREHTEVQAAYTQFISNYMNEREPGSAPNLSPIYVFNNNVRDWGHQFIYDEAALKEAHARIGFQSVIRCAINESPDPELQNREHEQRNPEGFVKLETITVEAEA